MNPPQLEGPLCGGPRLRCVALARLVDLKAALLADEARARGLTGRACECRNWHGARATSSVDGWASMAMRSDVVEAAGVRSSERRRSWADSSKRASEPDAEPPPGSCLADPATPTGSVAVWPEEPGLTPAHTLLRRRHAPSSSRSPRRLARRRLARRRHAGRRHAAVPTPSPVPPPPVPP